PPMTNRRPPSRLRALSYRVFFALPRGVRRRLVRLLTPTYTLGALTLTRSLDGERILLLRQPPGFGWSLPGGLMERGEDPATCAARELAEETGIAVDPTDLTPAAPNAIVHHEGQWVDLVFQAEVDPDAHELVLDGVEVLE